MALAAEVTQERQPAEVAKRADPDRTDGLAAADARDPSEADARDPSAAEIDSEDGEDASTPGIRRPVIVTARSIELSDSTPRVVFDDSADIDEPEVSARRTERGVYLDRVYDLLMKRWNPSEDLTLEQRVLGVTGDVTVRLVIEPSGRVRSEEIERSSGNPYLDYLAAEAIPKRLPRFHGEMEQVAMVHLVTFKVRR
jgi:TonB family protein